MPKEVERLPFYAGLQEPLSFGFLLADQMSMMSLASAIEPLRGANRLLSRDAFRWRLCSLDGAPVVASNGIPFPAEHVAETIKSCHVLFLCGGTRLRAEREKLFMGALRKASHAGLALGALSTGCDALAKGGFLEGYRCTTHWENQVVFDEHFAHLEARGTLYEIDRNRLTCSGGTATMDMMLHIISDLHGVDLARGVANQYHHDRIRASREGQRGGQERKTETLPTQVRTVVHLMQANMEDPIKVERLATMVGLSARQLERQFKHYLNSSPGRYYLSLRVRRAREFLLYTDQPIIDIAVAVGFASTSHFSRWFKEFYHMRPSKLRELSRTDQFEGWEV